MSQSTLSKRLSKLRSDIDKAILVVLAHSGKDLIDLPEDRQFSFENTEETVKSVMLRDDGMVLVFTKDEQDEETEYDFTDLPTDEMLAVYDVLLTLNK